MPIILGTPGADIIYEGNTCVRKHVLLVAIAIIIVILSTFIELNRTMSQSPATVHDICAFTVFFGPFYAREEGRRSKSETRWVCYSGVYRLRHNNGMIRLIITKKNFGSLVRSDRQGLASFGSYLGTAHSYLLSLTIAAVWDNVDLTTTIKWDTHTARQRCDVRKLCYQNENRKYPVLAKAAYTWVL